MNSPAPTPTGSHVCATVLGGAVAAAVAGSVITSTAQHAWSPPLAVRQIHHDRLSFTLTMVGTSVGSTAEDGGRSTSPRRRVSRAAVLARRRQISHSICTMPVAGSVQPRGVDRDGDDGGRRRVRNRGVARGRVRDVPLDVAHVDDA